MTCEAAQTSETYQIEFLGYESMTIDGEEVRATGLRRRSTLSDGSEGQAVVEVWRLEGTALIVQMSVERSSVTPSAAGDVSYREAFTLDLIDLLPEA